MAINKLSECKSLTDLKDFTDMLVPKAGACIGRKFKIADHSYTVNQLYQQLEKSIQLAINNKEVNLCENLIIIKSNLDLKEKEANDKINMLSPAAKCFIRIWQAVANFFAEIFGWHREQVGVRSDKLLETFKNSFESRAFDSNVLNEEVMQDIAKLPEFPEISKNFVDFLPVMRKIIELMVETYMQSEQAHNLYISNVEGNIKDLFQNLQGMRIEFANPKSMSVDEFSHLIGTRTPKFQLVEISNSDRVYITRV